MLKFSPEVDEALVDFMKLVISEVKKEKGIDVTHHIENVAARYSRGGSTIPLSTPSSSSTTVDDASDVVSEDTFVNKSDNTSENNKVVSCEFTYSVKYKDRKTGHVFQKGDKCGKDSVPGLLYCKSHKGSKQALAPVVEVIEVKKELQGYKLLSSLEKEPDTKFTLQEYYTNPERELTHLYEKVYVDSTNTVVMENPDTSSDNKWILVCKSIINDQGKRVIKRFSETVLNELHKQRVHRHYNYIIEDNLFRQVVSDYAAYTTLSNS
ncbi:hypothetical protein CONCODRAFT_79105 [Conidiobolus coronatus NRRL 28638]|uniref:Uncharacterized protein n=1 Tax=Conidiobolus coronatus (strain ATCC 28846 / CBS 209.66 / NRRL 28638) TaxID=796925 RepID=A0A137P484_CONC2|nr:hypothetical protein CONCODRAFT_79105 [Conidiobolus coronatus NRRL 28638]|eukprot:KXN69840.1 hypothetical protein CONCODRAFT_79105 [Conidiobolus coronatus NRRL 28638]